MTYEEAEQHLEDIECDLRFMRNEGPGGLLGTEIWHALEQVRVARDRARKEANRKDDD